MNCPTLIEAYEKTLVERGSSSVSTGDFEASTVSAAEEPLAYQEEESMEEDKPEDMEEEQRVPLTRPLTRAEMFAETVKLFFQSKTEVMNDKS
jgi:hypothetical protein